MQHTTVKELAESIKISVERLLEQFKEAGITSITSVEQPVSEDAKVRLLKHLQSGHGFVEAPKKNYLKA